MPAPEQPELFLKKLQQCCTVFDFMDTLSDLKMKEYKRSTLNELVDYVTVSRGYLTEQAYPEVVKMVSGRGLAGAPPPASTSESRESKWKTLALPANKDSHIPVVTRAVLMSFLMSTFRCLTTYSGLFRPATVTSLTQRKTNRRSRPPGHTYRCASWKRLQSFILAMLTPTSGWRPLVVVGGIHNSCNVGAWCVDEPAVLSCFSCWVV